jgi:hypothetical protein
MKKHFLNILLLLITTLNYAQNSKIKYGVQAGLNYSTLLGYDIPTSYNPFYSEKPAFAFLVGVNFEYQIKEKWSLKLNLNYERKSQKSDNNLGLTDVYGETIGNYDFTLRKNYDYLVLPIMAKYSFGNENSFYVNGGPFIGYLLQSNVTNDLKEIDEFSNSSLKTTDGNNKIDLGLSIGLGKTIAINEKNSIFIEIRENLGLTNTSKNKVWGDGVARTNSLSLIVGFFIN